MPKNTFKNVTHFFHDWDGVYTHAKSYDVFWQMYAKLVVEAGLMSCLKDAEVFIRQKWKEVAEKGRSYETGFALLYHEYGVSQEFGIKRHHEILFQEFFDNFTVTKGIPALMDKLSHLNHNVLTHANRYWIDSWSDEVGVKAYYDDIICSIEQGFGRKEQDLHLYSDLEKRFNVNPENCLLIDDSLPNLQKANEAGWKTVWRKQAEEDHPDYVDLSYLCVTDFLKDSIKHT